MTRKMIALNVALLLVVGWAGYLFRNELQASREREAKMRQAHVKALQTSPLPPMPVQPPVMATGYKDVAMKTLFHPSRNPDLPPPPPPPAPPPPPPMPDLPKYRGTVNFGDGPQALLSLGNAPVQPVGIGETIGVFKLVDVTTADITFDYQGTVVRRTLAQLTDRTVVASASGGADNTARTAATTPPPTVQVEIPRDKGPGEKWANGSAPCQPNDSTPVGTVVNGLRKVEIGTPFGKACRWDPIGR
jgi:hypothetical protein